MTGRGSSSAVIASMTEFSVTQAIEIEREGDSVWESLFGLAIEVNSTSRLRLSLMAEHVRGGGYFEDVVAHWESVKQFGPPREAQ